MTTGVTFVDIHMMFNMVILSVNNPKLLFFFFWKKKYHSQKKKVNWLIVPKWILKYLVKYWLCHNNLKTKMDKNKQ